MPQDTLTKPPASPDEEDLQDDASITDPSSDESSAQAAGNEERNRQAQRGRELAQAKREAEEARRLAVEQGREIQTLRAKLDQITGHLSQQAEAQRNAQLAALPPDKRAAAELQLLRQEVAALRAQPPRTAQQGPDPETMRMARNIVQEYTDDFDLDDGTIDLKDPRLVWDSEEDFRNSVRRVAKQERRAQQARGDTPVAKKTQESAQPKADKDVVNQTRRAVLDELGLSRPNSAQPAAGRGSASDDIASLHAGYSAKRGMKGQLEKLREIRDANRAG